MKTRIGVARLLLAPVIVLSVTVLACSGSSNDSGSKASSVRSTLETGATNVASAVSGLSPTVAAGRTVIVSTVTSGATVVSGTVTSGAAAVSGTVAAGATTLVGTVSAGPLGSGTPTAGSTTVKVGTTSLGPVLADAKGMTLYVYSSDVAGSGESKVTGPLATSWPPLILASGNPTKPSDVSGELTVISRPDGTKQVAYKGQPLYLWQNDKAPGDATGQNVAGFVVAKP